MEQPFKIIAAGAAIFLLGVGTSYWLLANNTAEEQAEVSPYYPTQSHVHSQPQSEALNNNSAASAASAAAETTEVLTHESFLAAADARREQQQAEKAEADILAKKRQLKADSVDCKFWRQQQKTSSAAAKIEEKITTHCFLASDLANSAAASSAANNELSGTGKNPMH
jgi:hypothetical protein